MPRHPKVPSPLSKQPCPPRGANAAPRACGRSRFSTQSPIRLILAMLDHESLPFGRFVPEPGPTASPFTITTLPHQATSQSNTYP